MSNIVVITFDNPDEAAKVRATLKEVEHQGVISLDDSAVVIKDEDGKIHVKDQMDRGVKVGAVGGGLLGLLIGGLIFPIGGLVIGAIGGALVGSAVDVGIQKSFIKEVSESLQPGSSAIFIVVRDSNPNAALSALKPYKGEVYHTSLPPEAEDSIRRVLRKRE